MRTLRDTQIHELVASAEMYNNDIICVQEHRFVHEDILIKEHDVGKGWKLITSSAWKNSINASIGGMLLSPDAYKAMNSIESLSPRILVATFNGNPQTVVSCYSPTNVQEEIDLSSVARHIPKHNVLVIGGDFNSHLGKDKGYKFAYSQITNRNGNMLSNFVEEQNLLPLNFCFQKCSGQKWTHTAPNGAKTQLDYVIINRKWKNSANDCRAYNTFEGVRSDHRIIAANLRLSLRANKINSSRQTPYDWSTLKKDSDIANYFTIKLKNRFEALEHENLESSPSTSFDNFTLSCEEAAKQTVPLKKKLKKRVPWENQEITERRKSLRRMAEIKNAEPTANNINNFDSARDTLTAAYEKEQKNYIQEKIEEITKAATNQKSSQAWKAVNEISGRKRD